MSELRLYHSQDLGGTNVLAALLSFMEPLQYLFTCFRQVQVI